MTKKSKHLNIFFRGLAGIPFSMGLDDMAKTIPDSVVYPFGAWKNVTKSIIKANRSGRIESVSLIGHSLGARVILKMVKVLQKAGVPVNTVICLDYVCNALGINDLKAPVDVPTYHLRSNEKARPRTLKNALETKFEHLNHVELDDDPEVKEIVRANLARHNSGI
ncbi:MAG: hypothetical protein KDD45_02395 [Bdellovibrionales bacterium]|nr:hypothetical protein [Bdellovibrionales bacterium]